METQFVECACHSDEHLLILRTELEENEPPFSVITVLLKPHSFFTRLFYAVRYIFGYQCKYGMFEEFLLNEENATLIMAHSQKFLGHWKKYQTPKN